MLESGEKVKVAQWGGRHIIYLPLYLAIQAGFCRDEGLDVELYRAGNDNEIFAEVAEGRATFGVGDPAFVALGAERGIRTKVIASVVNNVCLWGVTHHDEIREIHELTDFVGLRFGCPPRPSTTYSVLRGLKDKHERLLKATEIVEAPIGQQTGLLASDKADVVIELEPMISLAVKQGLRVVLSLASFYGDFLVTGITTTQETIDKNPELPRRFVRALQRGLNLCNTDEERTLALSQELFPTLPGDILKDAIARLRGVKTWPTEALIQPRAWRAALELRRDIGELKRIADPESLLDQSFAYQALTQA